MGIVCVTAFYYVANFPNDALPIKLVVLANVILCIAGTITDGQVTLLRVRILANLRAARTEYGAMIGR